MTNTENTTEAPAPAAPPATNGEYLYFKKVMAGMPFFVNGKRVEFEPLDRNLGVLKISPSDGLVLALTAAAEQRRGGIVAIDASIYEDLKKKLPFILRAPRSKPPVLQVLRTEAPRKSIQKNPADHVVVANPFSDRAGVRSVGGVGTGSSAGTQLPAPVPSTTEFKPETGPKTVRQPVLRKPTGNSLSGGVPEQEPKG